MEQNHLNYFVEDLDCAHFYVTGLGLHNKH